MRTIALSMVLGMAVLVSAGVQRVDAGVLYGATGSGGVNGELYILNQTTGGIIQDIGALVDSDGKHYSITGLAFQPGTGGNGNRKGNHFGRRKGARSAIEKGTTCLTRY